MSLTQTHAKFEETSYTLIGALQNEDQAEHAAAEITRLYWPPVYAYLRHTGKDRDQSAEITQAFFYDKILRLKLFERADPSEGRVRNLILTSLKNYLIDRHRKELVRGKDRLIPLESIVAEDHAVDASIMNQDPLQAFDQRWATAQLEESMRRCESHFRSSGRDRHWDAFADRVYHPAIHGTTPTPLKVLAPALGFPAAADAAAAVQLVKKRAVSFLREVISESTTHPADAQNEYDTILGFLQSIQLPPQ